MAPVTALGTRETVRRTGRGTAPRRTGSARRNGRNRAAEVALFLLAGWIAAFALSPAGACAQEGDTVLPDSGIRYPGGFDPNTVGTVRGKAHGLLRPASGPVRFRLDSGRDTYTVIASPGWFWDDLNVEIPEGAQMRVVGSKSLGRDGRLYIVAQEVEIAGTGRSLAFRDDGGHPLWRGPSGGGAGRGGHMGGPMGGMGGMGPGPGRGMGGHR